MVERSSTASADVLRPLAGVRVLELSQIMAGPTCGLMLSDMGADVVKIERFPHGDDARGYRQPNDPGLSPAFVMLNRGKRSIALDLRTPEGRDVLLRMAAQADVVTENFRVGAMERLGLGYEVFQERNPALIYCAISGYGRQGDMAGQGGFDLILQAFSGLISVTGDDAGRRAKPGNSVADINAGILAALGIVSAYVNRLRTGRGCRVDTSLLQASLQQMYWFAAAYFSQGIVGRPMGTAHSLIAPYQTFACLDGEIAIGGGNQANWERIAQVLGRPEWLTDARFRTGSTRLAHRHALAESMSAILRDGTRQHWLSLLLEAGVPAGPVQAVDEALDHPQVAAVGMVVETDDERSGSRRSLGLPLHFDGASPVNVARAPMVGEDTRAVLGEFGFLADAIDGLLERGVVFQPREGEDGFMTRKETTTCDS